MQVRNRFTNEISTVPFSYNHNGTSGVIIIDDAGRGNEVFFVYGVNIDLSDDDYEYYPRVSMYNTFSLDLTPISPEEQDPEVPIEPVEPTRVPIFTNVTKSLITSGTYDGETMINLFVSNNSEGYDIEFSTFFHGSLSGTEGNYTPDTWGVIDRELNESYNIVLPSITPENPRPLWARFVGNTANAFAAFYTFRLDGSDPELDLPPSGVGGSDELVLSPEESLTNWVSWERFADKEVNLPAGMDAVLGFGSPIYANDPNGTGGKHLALKIGYTYACNVTAYPKYLNKYSENNIYIFTQPFQLIQFAALTLKNQIIAGLFPTEYPSGYTDGGVWGNLSLLAFPNDGTNYSGITQEGARKLGEYCYYQRAWSLDPATANTANPQYNINNNQAWIMLDDEQIPYSLGGIGKMNFLAGINRGIKTVAPNVKNAWYAVPNSFFFNVNQDASLVSDSMIQTELLSGSLSYNSADFKDYGYWIDSGIYVKVPTITSHNKYKKSGGSFVISGGKRVYDDVDFTEVIYGETTTFLSEPDDQIKYLLRRDSDNSFLIGSTYWDGVGTGSPTPKAEYVSAGYVSWGRPNPSEWKPETQLNTEFYYSFASVVLSNLIYNSRIEYGNTDISTYRSSAKCLSYVELRLKTEEFTANGNSIYSRQIGAGLLTFCQLFSYLSGVRAVSLWENGKDIGADLPNRGSVLYPITEPNSIQRLLDNYSGLTHRTDSLNLLARELNGTTQANWRYIHFYYPVAIQNRYGVIGTGIYTGNKFIFMLINPTLNFDETQNVTLNINGTNYVIQLKGDGFPHYGVIRDLPSGLTPSNFTLSYTTIYGKNLVMSGTMNGTLSSSIISET